NARLSGFYRSEVVQVSQMHVNKIVLYTTSLLRLESANKIVYTTSLLLRHYFVATIRVMYMIHDSGQKSWIG
ncbi:hypothetical protein Csa_001581, partial [Cucumis sativus]